jgi:hypothetical protein
MRRGRAPLAGVIIVTMAGCAAAIAEGPPREGAPAPVLSDLRAEARYQSLLARFVRRAEIYQGLDARMFFAAAYEGLEFREARVERLAVFRGLSEAESAVLAEREREDHGRWIDFTVGVHANERRWDDLSRPSSVWRIALVTEAEEVLPVAVARLPRPDPNARGLYPFLENFWTAYRMRFPATVDEKGSSRPVLPDGTRAFALRFASALGKAELRFEFPVPFLPRIPEPVRP